MYNVRRKICTVMETCNRQKLNWNVNFNYISILMPLSVDILSLQNEPDSFAIDQWACPFIVLL